MEPRGFLCRPSGAWTLLLSTQRLRAGLHNFAPSALVPLLDTSISSIELQKEMQPFRFRQPKPDHLTPNKAGVLQRLQRRFPHFCPELARHAHGISECSRFS